jgi:ferric-dicitrate binding protein FerR (iron transport regulator)
MTGLDLKLNILKEHDLEKINRYLDGTADAGENDWVESLFAHGEDNLSLKYLLENEWHKLLKDSNTAEPDFSRVLDHIHHLIRIQENRKRKKTIQRIFRIYARVAAVLLIPVMIAGGLLIMNRALFVKPVSEQMVTSSIYAPKGSRISFTLPDGSSGMLNGGSKLTYNLPFSSDRKLKLEGEAWFDVVKDEKHPVEITAGSAKVKVLGTSFNLMAYPEESYLEVVLKTGKVEFQADSTRVSMEMQPSERLVYTKGEISRWLTDPDKYTGWTKGRLVFNKDPMAEVARRIERWYNVTVILADKALEKYSFRGTFEDDSLEEVMRLLAMTSPIRYKISPRKLLPDGTYEKEKVTIYLKQIS